MAYRWIKSCLPKAHLCRAQMWRGFSLFVHLEKRESVAVGGGWAAIDVKRDSAFCLVSGSYRERRPQLLTVAAAGSFVYQYI